MLYRGQGKVSGLRRGWLNWTAYKIPVRIILIFRPRRGLLIIRSAVRARPGEPNKSSPYSNVRAFFCLFSGATPVLAVFFSIGPWQACANDIHITPYFSGRANDFMACLRLTKKTNPSCLRDIEPAFKRPDVSNISRPDLIRLSNIKFSI